MVSVWMEVMQRWWGGGRDVSKSRLPKRGAERPFMSPLSLSDGLIAVTTVVKELVCNFGSR